MKVNSRIDNWDLADARNAPSIEENLKELRTTIERKLEMYHEGTVVHTQYILFLDQIDRLLESVNVQ